ncbi:MAG: hypothetical protein HYW02_05690 [Deltaproteobacteria bacterium]|nr:hypothetical protein [Deltaproteobacteria bacterium]MBI4196380.1 hypothetical protein [Deltaproteobacteria bacterium]
MKEFTPSSIRKRSSGQNLDPYLSRRPPEDRAVCRGCHAVYHNRHWTLTIGGNGKIRHKGPENGPMVLCPACQKIGDRFPSGVIQLKGAYLKLHRTDIINLIRNEETRARGFNPLERIMSIHETADGLKIETTSEKLAQRIGNRLQRAHKGEVHYHWSNNEHFVRVEWARD